MIGDVRRPILGRCDENTAAVTVDRGDDRVWVRNGPPGRSTGRTAEQQQRKCFHQGGGDTRAYCGNPCCKDRRGTSSEHLRRDQAGGPGSLLEDCHARSPGGDIIAAIRSAIDKEPDPAKRRKRLENFEENKRYFLEDLRSLKSRFEKKWQTEIIGKATSLGIEWRNAEYVAMRTDGLSKNAPYPHHGQMFIQFKHRDRLFYLELDDLAKIGGHWYFSDPMKSIEMKPPTLPSGRSWFEERAGQRVPPPSDARPRVRELLTLKGHSRPVRSVSFSPDGKRIVSGSRDRTLRVWDARSLAKTR